MRAGVVIALIWTAAYLVTSALLGTYGDLWPSVAVGVFTAFLTGWYLRGRP